MIIRKFKQVTPLFTLFVRVNWLAIGLIAISGVTGCRTNSGPTAHVDVGTQDTTSASAMWLQADIPNRPLTNVFLKGGADSSDISVAVESNTVVTLTALASDNDSGIQRLSLDGLVTIKRVSGNGWFELSHFVSRSFGSTSVPATIPGDFPLTMRVSGPVDFGALGQGADWVVVNVAAVAVSGAPPASGNPAQTYTMTLYWKRPGTPP